MKNMTIVEKEMVPIEADLVKMGNLCIAALKKTLDAFGKQDREEAQEVVKGDKAIDALDNEIEQKTFRILLLDNPVARDFHAVGSALKMITDLERIGDYCVDIAEEIIAFPDEPYYPSIDKLIAMGFCVQTMVSEAMKYYEEKDVEKARTLAKEDDRVDRYFAEIKSDLTDLLRNHESKYDDQTIIFMMIAKYLERIGDHAVNIGEWTDYSSTGSHEVS